MWHDWAYFRHLGDFWFRHYFYSTLFTEKILIKYDESTGKATFVSNEKYFFRRICKMKNILLKLKNLNFCVSVIPKCAPANFDRRCWCTFKAWTAARPQLHAHLPLPPPSANRRETVRAHKSRGALRFRGIERWLPSKFNFFIKRCFPKICFD
jgi:hypothetical protein